MQALEQHVKMQLGRLGERGNAILETVIRECEGYEVRQVRAYRNLIETVQHPTTRTK
jgi:hypothetical protein